MAACLQTRLHRGSDKLYLTDMSDRLPPLTALRAFEAAARHLSFAKAAAELNVTPAALSFQIKSLEEHLGRPVFRRLNRAVELTEAGESLAPGATAGFEALTAAWRSARRVGDGRQLTITAGPAFTLLWLSPRLFSFASAHPDIELRFAASLRIMDFNRDEIDIAIRFGKGGDAGLFMRPLMDEWVTPMVAPELAERIRTPADLAKLPLLQDDLTAAISPTLGWSAWFEAAGEVMPEPHGARFNQADHAISAALAGAGAILGRITLTEGLLRSGRLVMPFDLTLRSDAAFRIFCPLGTETRPHVAAFLEWSAREVETMKVLDKGRRFVPAPAEDQ